MEDFEDETDEQEIDNEGKDIPVPEEIKIDTTKEGFFEELDKIKAHPYEYIQSFYEELYPQMGGRVMSVLSLVPPSLVLPDFMDSNGKKTTSRISYLLLSCPGTAKTSLSVHFGKFAKNPFPFEYITDSYLSKFLDNKNEATLVTSDVARIFRDPFLTKQVENIIGDEGKLSRMTMRSKLKEEKQIRAVGFFAGTPVNLSSVISDGIIFRVSPEIIWHTMEQHEDILKKVNERIGNSVNHTFLNKEDSIIYFYRELYKIQEGKGTKPKITGYIVPQFFREEITEKLIPLFRLPFKTTNFEFIRELNQCYKYMVAHAFLNVYNRKVVDGNLILEDADLRIAMVLSEREIKTKAVILKCINMVSEQRMKVLQDLNYYAKYLVTIKKPLTELEYRILQNMLRGR